MVLVLSVPHIFLFFSQLETISEESAISDKTQMLNNFLPTLRSGEWSDIGGRSHMEDTHVCIPDLAMNFGYAARGEEAMSFYGVSCLICRYFSLRRFACELDIDICNTSSITYSKLIKKYFRLSNSWPW